MDNCMDCKSADMPMTSVKEVREVIIPKVRIKHVTFIVEDREFTLTEDEIKEATGKENCWAFNRLSSDDDVMRGALLKGLRTYGS